MEGGARSRVRWETAMVDRVWSCKRMMASEDKSVCTSEVGGDASVEGVIVDGG